MKEFDPYRPPRSGLDQVASQCRVWRYKRLVVVDQDALLPGRCYRCNADESGTRLSIRAYWTHPWATLALVVSVFVPVFGLMLFFIGLVLLGLVRLRKRAVVEYSICRRHNRIRLGFIFATVAVVSGSLAFSAWVLFGPGDVLAWPGRDALLAGSALSLLVGLLVGVIGQGMMRPAVHRYTGDTIWLRGFGKSFRESLEEYRTPDS